MELTGILLDFIEPLLCFVRGLGGLGPFGRLGDFEVRLRQLQRDPLIAVGAFDLFVAREPVGRVCHKLAVFFVAAKQHQSKAVDLVEHRRPLSLPTVFVGRSRGHHFVVNLQCRDEVPHLFESLALPHLGINAGSLFAVLLIDGVEFFVGFLEHRLAIRISRLGIGQADVVIDCPHLESRVVPRVHQSQVLAFGTIAGELFLAS